MIECSQRQLLFAESPQPLKPVKEDPHAELAPSKPKG
jgi:hypothetical protein